MKKLPVAKPTRPSSSLWLQGYSFHQTMSFGVISGIGIQLVILSL